MTVWAGYEDDYTDWLNDLMLNSGDAWDGDEAMESLVTKYIHGLETALALAIGRIERGEPGAALTGLKAARGDFNDDHPAPQCPACILPRHHAGPCDYEAAIINAEMGDEIDP